MREKLFFYKICISVICFKLIATVNLYSQNENNISRGYLLKAGSRQWQFDNRGENGLVDIDLDVPEVWRRTINGKTESGHNIVIAVIDGGVNISHPDLVNNLWINKGEVPENGIDDDNNGFVDDIHGWNFSLNTNDVGNNGVGSWHGTPINGIIAAETGNQAGVSGIAGNVKLLNLVRGDDVPSIIACNRYILNMRKRFNETDGRQGAFIVAANNSWGKEAGFAAEYPEWCETYNKLGEAGIISVIAAPNSNTDIDKFGDMPSTCTSEYIITVTNTNHNDKKVDEASYGSISVDIGAPGEYSYTTLNNGIYGYFGGTSAAAPYVSGLIGLLYSTPSINLIKEIRNRPNVAALKMKDFIHTGGEQNSSLENLTTTGKRINALNSFIELCSFYNENNLLESVIPQTKYIKLYPNPASEFTQITIELREKSEIELKIYNISGILVKTQNRIVLPKGIHSIEINTHPLNRGLYFINIQTPKTILSKIPFVKL